ncbi:MAG: helix-turn-helix transcriptional regulator [Candidatus Omnitrophica bacterium]|nr:helix-turn-helix transcriptional regulator [Candidatus Omnitrophota bacterium]
METSIEIGARIRALRKEHGLSLEQLAEKANLALATLSRIENGKGTGTFRTHRRIAEALNLSIVELYRGLQAAEEEAALLETAAEEAETFLYDEKASSILLARQVSSKQMLPQLVILKPGGKTTLEQYRRPTERWIFVLEGAVEAAVGSNRYEIRQGGTLYFKASFHHQFGNVSSETARLISVTSPSAL